MADDVTSKALRSAREVIKEGKKFEDDSTSADIGIASLSIDEDIFVDLKSLLKPSTSPKDKKGIGCERIDFAVDGLPSWSSRQDAMLWYFEMFGVIGLAYSVKEIAKWELMKANNGQEPEEPEFHALGGTVVPTKRTHSSDESSSSSEDNTQTNDQDEEDETEIEESQNSQRSDGNNSQNNTQDSQEQQVSGSDSQNSRDADDSDEERKQRSMLEDMLDALISKTGSGHKSWRRIFYDWYRGPSSRMLFYLSSVPEEVMLAILRGNLPGKMTDPAFRRENLKFLSLTDYPGSYCIYLTQKEHSSQYYPQLSTSTSTSTHPTGVKALGLSLEEIRQLHQTASSYIDMNANDFFDIAEEIDSKIGSFSEEIDYTFQRRYGATKTLDNFKSHEAFLEAIGIHLVQEADRMDLIGRDDLLNASMERCLCYVGVSSMVRGRCSKHWTGTGGGTPIMGMVVAIPTYLFPQRFDIDEHNYQIFKVVDQADYAFSEILTSIICSGYHWDLGLSDDLANNNRLPPEKYDRVEINAKTIRDQNVQASQIKKSTTKIERFKYLSKIDIKDAREKVKNKKSEMEDALRILEESADQLETESLKKSLDELMRL